MLTIRKNSRDEEKERASLIAVTLEITGSSTSDQGFTLVTIKNTEGLRKGLIHSNKQVQASTITTTISTDLKSQITLLGFTTRSIMDGETYLIQDCHSAEKIQLFMYAKQKPQDYNRKVDKFLPTGFPLIYILQMIDPCVGL